MCNSPRGVGDNQAKSGAEVAEWHKPHLARLGDGLKEVGSMEDEKLIKAWEFLQDYFKEYDSMPAYNCRNTEGDDMETIYEEDGIIIEWCYNFSYIEVLGLTEAEFDKLLEMSNGFL